jgi:hypothetical protein
LPHWISLISPVAESLTFTPIRGNVLSASVEAVIGDEISNGLKIPES